MAEGKVFVVTLVMSLLLAMSLPDVPVLSGIAVLPAKHCADAKANAIVLDGLQCWQLIPDLDVSCAGYMSFDNGRTRAVCGEHLGKPAL